MTTAIKRRRGTTAQHATFTGLEGEITVDTTKDTLVVHDGATAGGFALLREDLSNNTNVASTSTAQTFTNKTINLSSNTLSGTTAQFNTALSDGDFATLAGAETLSNKTFSTNPTISSGTANGVAYLNGSKVLTTGSALTFNGTNFDVNGGLSSAGGGSFYGNVVPSSGSSVEIIYTGSTGYITSYNRTGAAYTDLSIRAGTNTIFSTNGTEQMRLTSTGLGIGTSSPAYGLHISGTGTKSYIRVSNTSGTYNAKFNVEDTGETTFGSHSNNPVLFLTNNTERMRLDTSGNLGLGVTPSGWVDDKALQLPQGSISSGYEYGVSINANAYRSASNVWRYTNGQPAFRANTNNIGFQWFTSASGTAGNAITFTQAMTLDASGNLGVGTSTPSGKLQINSSAGAGLLIGYNSTSVNYIDANTNIFRTGSFSETMRIDASGNVGIGTSSPDGKLVVYGSAGSNPYSHFKDASGADFYIQAVGNSDCRTGTASNHPWLFMTNSTERMRIDSSGSLLVGTTNTGYSNNNSMIWDAPGKYAIVNHSGTSSGAGYVLFSYNGSGIGAIAQNGTTAVSYNTTSDYRLKENIQPMQNALATVAQLNPVTYNWKADGSDGQGFIAHELQAVVPDCVTGEKDAVDAEGKPVYQGIDTSFLVATLTKAIQEQQEQINQLKAEVAALKQGV